MQFMFGAWSVHVMLCLGVAVLTFSLSRLWRKMRKTETPN
jgi:hypothetical protein